MTTVRSKEGTLSFKNLRDARRAFKAGLIDPEDVIESPGEPTRTAGEAFAERAFSWKRHYDWFLFAPAFAVGGWFAGMIGVAAVLSSLLGWMVFHHGTGRRGRGMRWW